MHVHLASYNIHGCVGLDGRRAPERIAAVLGELAADVVALQEVDTHFEDDIAFDQLEYLTRATRMQAVACPTVPRRAGHFGNAVLTRFPVRSEHRFDLSVDGREPRGGLDVTLDVHGVPLRVIVVHLGLSRWERRIQLARILTAVVQSDGPTVLLGDVNEWIPLSRAFRALDAAFGASPKLRTFPSFRPVFALDRIWARPRASLTAVSVHRTAASRVASDHLPIRASVAVE